MCPRGAIGLQTWTVTYSPNITGVFSPLFTTSSQDKSSMTCLGGSETGGLTEATVSTIPLVPLVSFEPALAALFQNPFQMGIGCWLAHI